MTLRDGDRGAGIRWTESSLRRAIEFVVVSALLVVVVPASAVVFVLVRIRLGSPALFRQDRLGRDGRPIRIVKFRSMTEDRDAAGGLLSDDERLTDFGRWLRSSSLDELPQLWNVLRGDMSLIGPRPLPATYLDRYTAEQRRRLDIAPGLTGWSQVNGRNGLSWPDKLGHDVWYVDHACWLVDLRILFRSVAVVLGRRGTNEAGHATMSELPPPPAAETRRFATDDRPAAIDGVEVAVFDGAAVMFDPASETVHRLDGFTAGVWMSCDGDRSVEQIAVDLRDALDADAHEEAIVAQVDRSLSALADHGLLVGLQAVGPPCIGCDRG